MKDHPIVIADIDGVIRFWNEAAEALFGHPAMQSIGQSLDLIVPEEHRAAHWHSFRRAIAAGRAEVEGRSTPFPVRKANGETASISGRLSLVRAASGCVVAAMVVFG